MRRTLIALTMLAAAGALAAGCGSNNSGSGGYGGGASPATTAAPSGTSSGGGRAYGGGPTSSAAGITASGTAVTIDNFAFAPATLEVKVGQKVSWTNKQQGVAHTVTADGAPSITPCRRGRRSRLPSPRRARSPTTAPSTRRCTRRSWCRSDLGRDQGSETATLSSGKPLAAPATRP